MRSPRPVPQPAPVDADTLVAQEDVTGLITAFNFSAESEKIVTITLPHAVCLFTRMYFYRVSSSDPGADWQSDAVIEIYNFSGQTGSSLCKKFVCNMAYTEVAEEISAGEEPINVDDAGYFNGNGRNLGHNITINRHQSSHFHEGHIGLASRCQQDNNPTS